VAWYRNGKITFDGYVPPPLPSARGRTRPRSEGMKSGSKPWIGYSGAFRKLSYDGSMFVK